MYKLPRLKRRFKANLTLNKVLYMVLQSLEAQ